jgi:hypothetical protein
VQFLTDVKVIDFRSMMIDIHIGDDEMCTESYVIIRDISLTVRVNDQSGDDVTQ